MFRCAPDYILRKSKLRVLLRETLKGIIIEMILCWIFPDCYCAHGFSCRSVPILNWLLKAGHAILFPDVQAALLVQRLSFAFHVKFRLEESSGICSSREKAIFSLALLLCHWCAVVNSESAIVFCTDHRASPVRPHGSVSDNIFYYLTNNRNTVGERTLNHIKSSSETCK